MDETTLSILFSDIKGYTHISQALPPSSLERLLDDYMNRMSRIIENNGGTIDKIMGDGILALFGAPNPLEDHAHCAVVAGLQMQHEVLGLQHKWQEASPDVDLQIRVGINTDKVLAGDLKVHGHQSFTALGDGVNLASRLQDKAIPGTVLLSHSTFSEIDGRIPCEAVSGLELKGYNDAYTAFRVTGWPHALEDENGETTASLPAGWRTEQRQSPRRPLKVDVTFVGPTGKHHETSLNISESGIFVQADEPNALGTQVTIFGQIPTDRGTLPVTIIGQVVRHNSADEPSGMAIQFLSVQAKDPETIHYFTNNVYRLASSSRSQIKSTGNTYSLKLGEAQEFPTLDGLRLTIPLQRLSAGDSQYLTKRLVHEFDRTRRYNHEFSCVAVRIGNLRQLGDVENISQALVRISEVLGTCVRTTDEVFYLKDGTFFVIAPETMANRISTLTRRLVEHVHELTTLEQNEFGGLEIKAGSFSFDGHNATSPDDILQKTLETC